jgi:hypothetical protein
MTPKNPPMTSATQTEMIPTCNETRAPKTIREKVSRPSSSVPIRFVQLGSSNRLCFCASGSNGAINGAASATATVSATITAPKIPIGFRHRFGNVQREPFARPARPSVKVSATWLIPA